MGEKNIIESFLQNDKESSLEHKQINTNETFSGFSEDLIDANSSQEKNDRIASENLIKKIKEASDEQAAPIFGDGEFFDPWREVANIRMGTKEERKKKLAIFKQKLLYQKRGIVEMQNVLFDAVEKPDMPSAEELKMNIAELKNKFALSQEQRNIFDSAVDICVQRHKGILENTADCLMENGSIDGEKLFQKVFSRMPRGKVEVIVKAITVYFKIFNFNDYAYTASGAYLEKRDPSREEIGSAKITGGRKLANSQIPGMEEVITLENVSRQSLPGLGKSSDRILMHEEKHNFNCLIYDSRVKTYNEMFPVYNENESSVDVEEIDAPEENVREIERIIERDSDIRFRVKDEICAYAMDGASARSIRDSLLEIQGLYEYGEYYKKENKREGEKFSREYIDLVESAIVAMFDLIENGYSRKEAASFLFAENLLKWRTVVDRQLGYEKNKKRELRDRKNLNPILYRIDRVITINMEKIFNKLRW